MKADQISPFIFLLFAVGFICMILLNGTLKSKTSSREKFSGHFILRSFSNDGDGYKHSRFGNGKSRNNECDTPQAFQPLILNQTKKFKYPYRERTEILTNQSVRADNSELLSLIRNYWIVNPNSRIYRFRKEEVDYSGGISPVVDSLLEYREEGFYVDIGASDGESSSTTLFFEKYRRWNGLLIEAESYKYGRLHTKNRQGLALNSCISPTYKLMVGDFTSGLSGRLVRLKNQTTPTSRYKQISHVQCLPLLSVFLAVGIETVDYLSLIQEGDELDILKTIPFDRFSINVITVGISPRTAIQSSITKFLKIYNFLFFLKLESPFSRYTTLVFKRKEKT